MLANIHEIRYSNLRKLYDGFMEREKVLQFGSIRAFAERTGLTQRYMGHLLACRKTVGTATARKIEGALNLAYGWMDHEHHDDSLVSRDERAFMDAMVELYRRSPEAARQEMIGLVRRRIELTDRLTTRTRGVAADVRGKKKTKHGSK